LDSGPACLNQQLRGSKLWAVNSEDGKGLPKKIRLAIEIAEIEFIQENGGGAGVRL
jgi:hypothetical protein